MFRHRKTEITVSFYQFKTSRKLH